MKKQKLNYIFINPNTPEATQKALQKIIVEKILQLKNNHELHTVKTPT